MCCMFRSVGFVFVVVLVFVPSAVVGCTVCVVTDFVDTVVACMVVVWVVCVAMIVVMFFVVMGFIAVTFTDADSMFLVVVHGNSRWDVGSVCGVLKKGSGRTHKGQFVLKSVQFLKKSGAVWFNGRRRIAGGNDRACGHDGISRIGILGTLDRGTCRMGKKFIV